MIQCPVESSLECTYVCFSSGLKCTLGIKRYEVLSFSTQTQHTYTTHKPMPHTHTLVRHTNMTSVGTHTLSDTPHTYTHHIHTHPPFEIRPHTTHFQHTTYTYSTHQHGITLSYSLVSTIVAPTIRHNMYVAMVTNHNFTNIHLKRYT